MTETSNKGKLTVIGMGPGPGDMMIPSAVSALRRADIIVGYTRYLNLLGEFTEGKETFGTGMKKETDRVRKALEFAACGRNTVLVSSGDAGVYGMAGLSIEMLHDMELEAAVDVKILPGITAASSCAALLGAPLMHDFAVISLSDLLTEKDLIKKRLRLAAEGDFVTVIYNPKSRRRVELIRTARDEFLRHRNAETPVGIVGDAYREECSVIITTLEDMSGKYDEIDMSSTVIIGNSSTKRLGDFIVTPRGYKY